MSSSPAQSEVLRTAWQAQFDAALPIGHQLRQALPQRWFRMHHLPESRRYPDTPARHGFVARHEATPVWRIEVCTVREAGECAWQRVPIDASEWAICPARVADEVAPG